MNKVVKKKKKLSKIDLAMNAFIDYYNRTAIEFKAMTENLPSSHTEVIIPFDGRIFIPLIEHQMHIQVYHRFVKEINEQQKILNETLKELEK